MNPLFGYMVDAAHRGSVGASCSSGAFVHACHGFANNDIFSDGTSLAGNVTDGYVPTISIAA